MWSEEDGESSCDSVFRSLDMETEATTSPVYWWAPGAAF